jgi:hypothetical protein
MKAGPINGETCVISRAELCRLPRLLAEVADSQRLMSLYLQLLIRLSGER